MIAYFKVQKNANDAERILKVDGVRNLGHAADIAIRIRQAHADIAVLLSLEEYSLHYTVEEIMNEKNLIGERQRWSTGERTVTIPPSEK